MQRHAKKLQKKSRTHTVRQVSGNVYEVTSGYSGNIYRVTFLPNGGAVCTCKWGQYRKAVTPQSGCSHVIEAYNFRETARTAYTWADPKDAKRQKNITRYIGDGLILTFKSRPRNRKEIDLEAANAELLGL